MQVSQAKHGKDNIVFAKSQNHFMDITKPFEVKITGQDGNTTTTKYSKYPSEEHIKIEFIQGEKTIETHILPNALFQKVSSFNKS